MKFKLVRSLPTQGDKCDFLFSECDEFKFMTPYHMFVKYVAQGDIVRLETPMDKILVPCNDKECIAEGGCFNGGNL